MKYLLMFCLLLTSCEPGPKPEGDVKSSNPDYRVVKLFTVDGCTVYRFYDEYERYFTNCLGSISHMRTQMEGKTTHYYPEQIDTSVTK